MKHKSKKDMKAMKAMKDKKAKKKKLHEGSSLKQFVSAILDKDYSMANNHLTAEINKKIKQKIINNNNNLF